MNNLFVISRLLYLLLTYYIADLTARFRVAGLKATGVESK